ncbi:MAG: hypothetical protein U0324_15390 [Polyangiales bacterium]
MAGVIGTGDRRYALGASRHHCGLGECFEAVDADDPRRRVVVKRLRGAANAPELRARFDAVGAALRGLSSPRVVRVLDVGWSDGPFVVLDAPKVPSLWQWMQEAVAAQTPVALTTVCRIIEDLCHAVESAHRARPANSLLHGTLCAQSVLVLDAKPETLRLKVTDFGLWPFARHDLAEMLPSPAADPRAPELLARPDALTAACDQFSLGVLLAALLTLPGGGPTSPGWGQLLREQPEALGERLRGLRDDARGSVREALARSLHPDPARRFENVEAFRAALLSADWRPGERAAVGAGRANGRAERSLDDFERVWGEAWKERARQGVLPSGLRASAPEQRVTSVARASPQPPAPAAAPEPEHTGVSEVSPRAPWRAPTPAALRAAEETLRERTPVPPKERPLRAPATPRDESQTLVDAGDATLLTPGTDRVRSLDEGTVRWVAPPPGVVDEAAQTLAMDAGAATWSGSALGYDAGGDTLVVGDGEGDATISMTPGVGEQDRTRAVIPVPRPVVRAPWVGERVDPGAWDTPKIDATLPMDGANGAPQLEPRRHEQRPTTEIRGDGSAGDRGARPVVWVVVCVGAAVLFAILLTIVARG